jgi:hypothetical protein
VAPGRHDADPVRIRFPGAIRPATQICLPVFPVPSTQASLGVVSAHGAEISRVERQNHGRGAKGWLRARNQMRRKLERRRSRLSSVALHCKCERKVGRRP